MVVVGGDVGLEMGYNEGPEKFGTCRWLCVGSCYSVVYQYLREAEEVYVFKIERMSPASFRNQIRLSTTTRARDRRKAGSEPW